MGKLNINNNFSGNSKTSICACISPFLMNYDETITTLQFASRAIKIKVNAHVNEKIEMKKLKDKLQDLTKIKNIESVVQEKNKLDKDANDLKSSLNNLKNDLKRVKNKNERSKSANREDAEEVNYNRSQSNISQKQGQYSSNSNLHSADPIELHEYTSITKKFHSMIVHLQMELAKATVMISNLNEENKNLKERLTLNLI